MDDTEPGPLELKLEEIEVYRESAKMMYEALSMRAEFLFEKADAQESPSWRLWYHHQARKTQRRARRYDLEANKYLGEYRRLRDQAVADLRKTIHNLNYQNKLELTPPAP